MSTTLNAIKAERIKLTSVKSPWWSLAIVVVLGLGFAAMVAAGTRSLANNPGSVTYPDGTTVQAEPESMSISDALGGVSGFGTMVLMILAVLAVTSEYRFGTIRTTFQAIPNRTLVLSAKTCLLAVGSAVVMVVLGLGAYALAKVIAGPVGGRKLTLSSAGAWREIYGLALYAVFAIMIAVAVGALLRQTAGAVALVLLWPLLVEQLVMIVPKVGDDIAVLLPFNNGAYFLSGNELSGANYHWGPWGGLLYFALWAVGLFAVAVFVTNKRDA